MKSTMPKTLSTATQHGLLRLMSLSLAYSPPGDVMPMTETTWIDALTDEHITDADVERIYAGFRVLARTCTAWPSPRDLINAMPPAPRAYFRALPKPEKTSEQDAAEHAARTMHMARIREIVAPFLKTMQAKDDQRSKGNEH